MTKSPVSSARTSTVTVTVLTTPAGVVTVAISVPTPACMEGVKMAVDSPSSGAMEPSDAELSAHSTRLPRREGARSALRNMGLPTVDTIDEADSSIPVSSETAWTRTGTEATSVGSARRFTLIVASPSPMAVTKPLSSTARIEVSDDVHVSSE